VAGWAAGNGGSDARTSLDGSSPRRNGRYHKASLGAAAGAMVDTALWAEMGEVGGWDEGEGRGLEEGGKEGGIDGQGEGETCGGDARVAGWNTGGADPPPKRPRLGALAQMDASTDASTGLFMDASMDMSLDASLDASVTAIVDASMVAAVDASVQAVGGGDGEKMWASGKSGKAAGGGGKLVARALAGDRGAMAVLERGSAGLEGALAGEAKGALARHGGASPGLGGALARPGVAWADAAARDNAPPSPPGSPPSEVAISQPRSPGPNRDTEGGEALELYPDTEGGDALRLYPDPEGEGTPVLDRDAQGGEHRKTEGDEAGVGAGAEAEATAGPAAYPLPPQLPRPRRASAPPPFPTAPPHTRRASLPSLWEGSYLLRSKHAWYRLHIPDQSFASFFAANDGAPIAQAEGMMDVAEGKTSTRCARKHRVYH
jgi:hypothetical protein